MSVPLLGFSGEAGYGAFSPLPLRVRGQGSYEAFLPSGSISSFLPWSLSFDDFLFLTRLGPAF